jgi:hypothetical protein
MGILSSEITPVEVQVFTLHIANGRRCVRISFRMYPLLIQDGNDALS